MKDTYREKAQSNKTPADRKSTTMGIWIVGTSNHLLQEVLKLKQKLRKNKVVIGKTPFFLIGLFCTHHPICLKLAPDMAVLYRNYAFSILVLSVKKQFLEKNFCQPENLFQ